MLQANDMRRARGRYRVVQQRLRALHGRGLKASPAISPPISLIRWGSGISLSAADLGRQAAPGPLSIRLSTKAVIAGVAGQGREPAYNSSKVPA